MHGVSYCHNHSHHHMQGRDKMAAVNIGCRFVAAQLGLDLGPWTIGSKLEEDHHGGGGGSTVLHDVYLQMSP